jgi:hypothetical protein
MKKVRLTPTFPLMFVLAASLFFNACRAPQSVYSPSTSNVGAAPTGHPSAMYEIPLGTGKGGQVVVWTEGVIEAESNSRAVRINMNITNDSSVAMKIVPSETRLTLKDETVTRALAAEPVNLQQGESAEVALIFPVTYTDTTALPDEYALFWQVHFGTETYHQMTPFTRETELGFVPRRLDSSADPIDRKYIEGEPTAPAPIGIPIGKDPDKP